MTITQWYDECNINEEVLFSGLNPWQQHMVKQTLHHLISSFHFNSTSKPVLDPTEILTTAFSVLKDNNGAYLTQQVRPALQRGLKTKLAQTTRVVPCATLNTKF